MDKNAIKKFAVWARRELISRVSQRAALYEITDKGYGDASSDSVLGRVMSAEEKRQRQALIAQIREKGYEQVMEEIAYTWFNRFIALRFMEVNGYLPSRVRVFTDDENSFKPQILAEAINMELDGLNMEKVYALKNANDDDALFKYMIIVQCNALSSILPGMFQRISDYTELLFPDNLLREGSVIEQMVSMIPADDWTDQVQIIGWLYQFYNLETFDSIYDGDMSRKKITKELIPAATQIFTPDWAVRVMVDNALGHLWLENHQSSSLKTALKYYLDDHDQISKANSQNASTVNEGGMVTPDKIRCIDPCMGSGHILCYLFDVLIKIYESYGYTIRDSVASIIEKNIWGLDIDERAAQLSYFAIMMKARQFDRRFFSRRIQPHIYAIVSSNDIPIDELQSLGQLLSEDERKDALFQIRRLVDEMKDADEYGCLIRITPCDWELLRQFTIIEHKERQLTFDAQESNQLAEKIRRIIDVGEALAEKYHVAVTNPPYLGNSRQNQKLSSFLKKHYSDEKSDLAMAVLDRLTWGFTKPDGYSAAITTVSWMYLKSFEQFRKRMICDTSFVCLVDYGTELFDGKIGHLPVASWVCKNSGSKASFSAIRLVDYCYSRRSEKEAEFFNHKNRFITSQEELLKIPGNPLAYWASSKALDAYNNPTLSDCAFVTNGLFTCDNNRFLRYWFEVNKSEIYLDCTSKESCMESNRKWYPYNKGGDFRRWYGNQWYVVNFKNFGEEIANYRVQSGQSASFPGQDYYFKPSVSWSLVSTTKFGIRYYPNGFVFDIAGSSVFPLEGTKINYVLGYLASEVALSYLLMLNPTVNYQAGDIRKLPFIKSAEKEAMICSLVEKNIGLVKEDWNAFETSWDFQTHPFFAVQSNGSLSLISECYGSWDIQCQNRFASLKNNEEEINRIFIDIYGLQHELLPEVENKDVTVRRADLQRDIRSFISYAVGCMFGRYSLSKPGLVFAGGDWDMSKYTQFKPDRDGILPICDDEYFEDDIVGQFVEFVKIVYGPDTLEENLRFIADALGGKGSPRDVIRSYFINDFYSDHLKIYQKRPIYWLFDSGKKNGFKCLIYMHRYQPDTIARIRTDYVHEQQSRYRTAIADLETRIASAGTGERVKLSKQLTKLQEQAEELRIYEEKIHHLADQMIRIDLDDGVKHNYAIFQDVLAKIK